MFKEIMAVIGGALLLAGMISLVYSCIRDARTPMTKQDALIVAHTFESRHAAARMSCVLEPTQSGQYYVDCTADR